MYDHYVDVVTPECKIATRRALDGTLKYGFALEQGLSAEAAYFFVEGRDLSHIACVSTQVGCAARCPFCSTASTGFHRNLTTDEIVIQASAIMEEQILRGVDEADFEVSFMGMGDPLANQRNVLGAIRGIKHRYPQVMRVALSTVGPARRIASLADAVDHHAIPIHLQISLHATSEAVRRSLVPNSPEKIENLLEAGLYYHHRTGDRVCLNYILLDEINDSPSDASWFARLDRDAFSVKLTVLNEIPALPLHLRPASEEKFAFFSDCLASLGIEHKIFRGDGLDVQASCGQLAAQPALISIEELLRR